MNKQEYINQIDAEADYCGCPSIEKLAKQGRVTEFIQEVCEKYEERRLELEGMDSHRFTPENEDEILDYLNHHNALEKAQKNYHNIETQLFNDGKLELILHNTKRLKPVKKVTLEEATKLQKRDEPIITINCANCHHTIDRLLKASR
jgi:hypothetical protein